MDERLEEAICITRYAVLFPVWTEDNDMTVQRRVCVGRNAQRELVETSDGSNCLEIPALCERRCDLFIRLSPIIQQRLALETEKHVALMMAAQ